MKHFFSFIFGIPGQTIYHFKGQTISYQMIIDLGKVGGRSVQKCEKNLNYRF